MRDLGKYRGRRKDNGEGVNGWYLEYDGKSYIFREEKGGFLVGLIEVIPKTVGESTGLTDKRKSQGLYDGDRVVIGRDVGVLVWDELDLCWALEIEDGSYQSLCRFYSYEEIDAVEYIGFGDERQGSV